MAALATLASVYAIYVDQAAFGGHVDDDRLRIRASIQSGIELTAYKLASASEDLRPPRGAFTLRLARSTIEVAFTAEGARIDLNAASKEMLAGLFAALGAKSEDAANYADRVVGWRKKGVVAGQNAEAALYRSAGYAYAPRQAPFRNVLELSLLLRIPRSLVDRALPFVTIFSGQGEIDIRVAEYVALSALPKATPEQISQVLAQRSQDAQGGEALLKLSDPRAPALRSRRPRRAACAWWSGSTTDAERRRKSSYSSSRTRIFRSGCFLGARTSIVRFNSDTDHADRVVGIEVRGSGPRERLVERWLACHTWRLANQPVPVSQNWSCLDRGGHSSIASP